MRRYAARTQVSADRSRLELEAVLRDAGARDIGQIVNDDAAHVMFRLQERVYRFTVIFPALEKTNAKRGPVSAARAQVIRALWRALLLVIRAKIESARAGITSLEKELLAYCVLPGGRTVADETLPRIAAAYQSGGDVPLLPPGA